MSSTLTLVRTLSTTITAALASLRIMQDVVSKLDRMQQEGREPTDKEWQELETRASRVDRNLERAIRNARRENSNGGTQSE